MCRARLLLLVFPFGVLAGCSRVDRLPTTPSTTSVQLERSASDLEAHGLANFYPLDIGNRWRYVGYAVSKYGDAVTSGRWTKETTLARSEVRVGRTYVLEEITRRDEQQENHFVRWLRQDRSGLFEFGVAPPRAPVNAESMLLAYAVHREASWQVSEYLRVTAKVEAMEVLDLPAGRFPAWRIRLRTEGHPPSEEVFVWYGRAGYLGMKRHDQSERRGPDGNPIKITVDEAEWLEQVDLARPR